MLPTHTLADSNDKFSFPANRRIKKRREFLAVQKVGRKIHSHHFLLIALLSSANESRLGVTVTTKVDKRSARRNKLRRRIKEIFRVNRCRLTRSVDIVIIARDGATELTFGEVRDQILGVLQRGKLLA